MGHRVMMLKQEVLVELLGPGSRTVTLAGPDIPADCRMVSFAYIPHAQAVCAVYESAQWSDLVVAGQMNAVNGIPVFPAEVVLRNFSLQTIFSVGQGSQGSTPAEDKLSGEQERSGDGNSPHQETPSGTPA